MSSAPPALPPSPPSASSSGGSRTGDAPWGGEAALLLLSAASGAADAFVAAAGALMAGRWGYRVPALLGVEVVLLGAAAALWGLELVSSYGDRLGLLSLVAVAMGVQGRVRVTPTNYFTGTLTSLAGRVALRKLRGGDGWVLGRLAAVVAGAAVAALAERWWSPGAALGAVVMAAGALALETVWGRGGRLRPDRRKPRPDRGNPAGAA
ncbi:DUF1275 domain-containing protein [Streptomyces badius]|uniref:DUF1275 family protein n=1 Tax=Streptomyces badius TaxID=1941 RepID=A0ABQ2T8U5_STRBA|nr:DUF1275 domain-containing protein [Streptomyces badius]GGS58318.1 hypothetical protein GCM10010253_36140 [Streptomyces badius]